MEIELIRSKIELEIVINKVHNIFVWLFRSGEALVIEIESLNIVQLLSIEMETFSSNLVLEESVEACNQLFVQQLKDSLLDSVFEELVDSELS